MTSSSPLPPTITDEMLSAYLDGQATAAEARMVEEALNRDLEVRQRYTAIQHSVHLLSLLPQASPPRAFVLSQRQVVAAGGRLKGDQQPSFWERIMPRLMPLATAAVAVALVVALGLDYIGQPASAPAPADVSLKVAEDQVASESSLSAIPQATMVAEEIAMVEPLMEAEPMAGAAAVESEMPAEEALAAEAPAAEMPAEEALAAEAPAADARVMLESESELVAPSPEDEEALMQQAAPAAELSSQTQTGTSVETGPSGVSRLRLIQIGLAVLLVLLIGVTLTMRRRPRSA